MTKNKRKKKKKDEAGFQDIVPIYQPAEGDPRHLITKPRAWH